MTNTELGHIRLIHPPVEVIVVDGVGWIDVVVLGACFDWVDGQEPAQRGQIRPSTHLDQITVLLLRTRRLAMPAIERLA